MPLMRQRDSVVIARLAVEVWPWIAEPERIALWNDKLEVSGAPSPAATRVGSSFGARYRMGRRATEVQATVEAWDPPRESVVRYRWGSRGWALERTTLDPVAGGTRLTRTVEIRDPGMPWPARVVAGLLMRFGRPPSGPDGRPGESTVDTIRRLIESGGDLPPP